MQIAIGVDQASFETVTPPSNRTPLQLERKKRGAFLVLKGAENIQSPRVERRDALGVTLEQERDDSRITANLLVHGNSLSHNDIDDALLAMITVRYTQSNSVTFARDGRTVGIGAGQQSRVDCTRLAAGKTSIWWTRRHQFAEGLERPDGMTRQDRVNWQMRLIENDLTAYENEAFARLFCTDPTAFTPDDRNAWTSALNGVTMASDGFLPFRDNVDHASRVGTTRIVEPGGSIRSESVESACSELGIDLIRTGRRLFHH